MKCGHIQLLLPDFAQGKSSVEENDIIREHLSQCSSCSDELAQIVELTTNLKHLWHPAPSPAYWGTILTRIHNRIDRRSSSPIPEWIVRYASPVAAALVLMIVVVNFSVFNGHFDDGDLNVVFNGLSGDELQQITDQAALNNDITSALSSEALLESSDDVDVLKQLLLSEDHTVLYAELDVDEATSILSDQEEEQLLSSLQQQSIIN